MNAGDVDLNKVNIPVHRPSLAKPAPGLVDPGGGAPEPALRLGEGAPTPDDGTECVADCPLGGGVGVGGLMVRVGDLPVAGSLIDRIPGSAGLGIGCFHNALNAISLPGLPREGRCQPAGLSTLESWAGGEEFVKA
jgi:hypothetical protein